MDTEEEAESTQRSVCKPFNSPVVCSVGVVMPQEDTIYTYRDKVSANTQAPTHIHALKYIFRQTGHVCGT